MKAKFIIIAIMLSVMYLTAKSQQKESSIIFQPIEKTINFVRFSQKAKANLYINTNDTINKISLSQVVEKKTADNNIKEEKNNYNFNPKYAGCCKVVFDTLIIYYNKDLENDKCELNITLTKQPIDIIIDSAATAYVNYSQDVSSLNLLTKGDAFCYFNGQICIDSLNVEEFGTSKVIFNELYIRKSFIVNIHNNSNFEAIKGGTHKGMDVDFMSEKGFNSVMFAGKPFMSLSDKYSHLINQKKTIWTLKPGIERVDGNFNIGLGGNFPLKSNSNNMYATNIGWNISFYEYLNINLTNRYTLSTGLGIIADYINMDKNLIIDDNNGGRIALYDVPSGVDKFSSKIPSTRCGLPIFLKYYLSEKRKYSIEAGIMPSYNVCKLQNTFTKDNREYTEVFKNDDIFNKFQMDLHFTFHFPKCNFYVNYGLIPLMNTKKADSFHTFNIGYSFTFFELK